MVTTRGADPWCTPSFSYDWYGARRGLEPTPVATCASYSASVCFVMPQKFSKFVPPSPTHLAHPFQIFARGLVTARVQKCKWHTGTQLAIATPVAMLVLVLRKGARSQIHSVSERASRHVGAAFRPNKQSDANQQTHLASGMPGRSGQGHEESHTSSCVDGDGGIIQ